MERKAILWLTGVVRPGESFLGVEAMVLGVIIGVDLVGEHAVRERGLLRRQQRRGLREQRQRRRQAELREHRQEPPNRFHLLHSVVTQAVEFILSMAPT